MELTITESRPKENTAVLSVEGRLNAITAGELKTNVKQLVAGQNIHIILDLKGATFIDSSGLSAIVSALKDVREKNGSLKLVGLNPNAKKVFELTRLDRIFEFYDDVEQALES